MNIKIRIAKLSDSPALRKLTRQLGYPLSEKQIRDNLRQLLKAKEHRVWVATLENQVVGMLHARIILALNLHRNAEGYAAAVDEKFRSLGIGKQLIDTMEAWLKKNKCNRIILYSNIKRKRTHQLYERIGYEHVKTSKMFEKWI